MKRKMPSKPYWEMSLDELREATKQYDKPIPMSKFKPLSKREREQFDRWRAKGVRSLYVRRRGANMRKSKTIAVRVDAALLRQSDAYVAQHGMTRDELINRGLKSALAVLV